MRASHPTDAGGGIIFEQRESTRCDRPKARRRGSQTGDIIYNFILSFSQYFCLTLKTHLPLIREMSFQSFYISEGGNFVILLYLKFLLSVVVEKIIFFSFTLPLT